MDHPNLWWEFVKKDWKIYSLGGLSVLICGTLQVLLPFLLGQGIDLIQGVAVRPIFEKDTKTSTFQFLFFLFLFANIFLVIGRWCWRVTLARMTHYAGSFLRGKIWERACYFPGELFQKVYTPGYLMNASTSDVHSARMIFGFTLVAVFDVVFLGGLTLILMAFLDKTITILMLFLFFILPPLIKKLSTKEMALYKKAQESLSFFHEKCSHCISTVRLQRLTQTSPLWEKILKSSAEGYRSKRLEATFCSLRFIPTMGIGTLFSYFILFGIGLTKVFSGSMSLGDFIIMQSYVLLLQDPILELGFIISEIQKGKTSLKRLGTIYQEDLQKNLVQKGDKKYDSDTGSIFKISSLSYKYHKNKMALGPWSFDVKKNEKLGIMGPTGSGKSTLLQILLGLKTNYEGEVLLCGKAVELYEHEGLRNEISMVSQNPFVFADTIWNNIQGGSDLTEDEIWHYLKIVELSEEVERFPHKIETPLGEWGLNLSGGQKQRLTLARALAKGAQFLLLDDCLSSVDTITEEKILNNLKDYLTDKTCIWVAHRKSTLKLCDRILEFNNA